MLRPTLLATLSLGLVALASCRLQDPPPADAGLPEDGLAPDAPKEPEGTAPSVNAQLELRCEGNLVGFACQSELGNPAWAIVGGHGTNVLLGSASLSHTPPITDWYVPWEGKIRFDTTITNLMAETMFPPLNVFFRGDPRVTAGHLSSSDPEDPADFFWHCDTTPSDGAFTGSGEYYYNYDAALGGTGGVLATSEQSGAIEWCFDVRAKVPDDFRYRFSVLVDVDVSTHFRWLTVSLGLQHTCAIAGDRSLWCWGRNTGNLGDGTHDDQPIPVRIGSGNDWKHVGAGSGHTCATKWNGELWCWGYNSFGQVGDGTTTARYSPVRIGADTDWAQVSGSYHTCATKQNGTLWCWGRNSSGQLGDGTISNRLSPVQVGSHVDWEHVVAGYDHTCAVRSGELWCWGNNYSGQLGDGTTTRRLLPVRVGQDTSWEQVSAGGHTCAIKHDGTLWCWGANHSGQHGDELEVYRTSPIQVGADMDWAGVAARAEHTCALKQEGRILCWGHNEWGQLGDGTIIDRSTPAPILADSDWKAVANNSYHTCGMKQDDTIWCWGDNEVALFGIHPHGASYQSLPSPVVSHTAFASVSTSEIGSCATGHDGTAWCWGGNWTGQVGDGTDYERYGPVEVAVGTGWISVSTAGGLILGDGDTLFAAGHSCGTKQDGTLWCWGRNAEGALGDGTDTESRSPVQVGTDSDWKQETVGWDFSCALKLDGTLWCWGRDWWGQLGIGAGPDGEWSPVQVGSDEDWKQISSGENHSCAVKEGGTLWCWGYNNSGQLGDGTTQSRSSPIQVGAETTWRYVECGSGHSCAIREDGTLWCWGRNGNYQLGLWSNTIQHSPTQVGSYGEWKQVSAGELHTCGIKDDGTIWCWGDNSRHQIGDLPNPQRHPAQLLFDTDWEQVSAGYEHTCGVKQSGDLFCWGLAHFGRLGDMSWRRTVPGRVLDP